MCIPCKRMEWVPSWRVSQLVKTFTTFYGMWRFRTVFSVAHHLSIFWASLIHCTLSHPVYFKLHWNIDLLRTPRTYELPLSSWFPQQNLVCISFLPHMCYMPCPSHPPSLIALMIFSEEAPYCAFFGILLYFVPFRPKMSSLASCSANTLVLHFVRDVFLHAYK